MSGRATTPPPQGDVNVSGGLLATTILVTVISILLLAARFATRIWIVKRVGWDDWTILLAVLGHPIGMALVVVQIGYGLGRPVFYLTEHQFQEFMKYAYGEWLQTFATLMFTKISICLFLLRITISKSFVRPLQAAIGILVVSNVILTVLWIVQCTPHLDKAWNTKLSGKCFGKGQLERIIIAQAIISFISDYFLSIFPILILRKVQISFRSKVGLCSLMGLGVVTGSLGVARTVLNWQNVTSDPTWLVIPNWYIRTWEVIFGIVAACVPTLRPGYKWLKGELHTQYTRHKGSPRSGSGQTPLRPDRDSVQWSFRKPTSIGDDIPPAPRNEKVRFNTPIDVTIYRSSHTSTRKSTLPLQRPESNSSSRPPTPPPKTTAPLPMQPHKVYKLPQSHIASQSQPSRRSPHHQPSHSQVIPSHSPHSPSPSQSHIIHQYSQRRYSQDRQRRSPRPANAIFPPSMDQAYLPRDFHDDHKRGGKCLAIGIRSQKT